MVVQLADVALAEEINSRFDYLAEGGCGAFAKRTENEELEHEGEAPKWVGMFFKGGPGDAVIWVWGNICLKKSLKKGAKAVKDDVFICGSKGVPTVMTKGRRF